MNKLYSVVYSPKAKDDLKEIYTYIAFTLSVPTTAEVKECAKLQLTNSLLFIL